MRGRCFWKHSGAWLTPQTLQFGYAMCRPRNRTFSADHLRVHSTRFARFNGHFAPTGAMPINGRDSSADADMLREDQKNAWPARAGSRAPWILIRPIVSVHRGIELKQEPEASGRAPLRVGLLLDTYVVPAWVDEVLAAA